MTLRHKITVLGGGMWGCVLAQHLANKGAQVRLWEFVPAVAESLKKTRRHLQANLDREPMRQSATKASWTSICSL